MTGTVDEALAQVRAGVDGLLSGTLTSLSGVEVVALIEGLETERRRLDAVDVRVVAEAEDRRLAGDYGRTSTADLLSRRLRITPREATARVARARDLGPRRELSGAPSGPILAAVAEALTAGELSASHASVISAGLDRLPVDVALEASPVAETMLVDAARHEDPRGLRRTVELLLARLNPDGTEPQDDLNERRRGFTITATGDGASVPSGRLTGETAAVWRTILDALAAPQPAGDGGADPRTASQRYHDALLDAGLRLLRSGSLPESGGVPVTVCLRTTPDDLARPGGLVQTAHGEVLSTRRALMLGCEIEQVDVECDGDGAVLNLGRTRRFASRAQRRALGVRDGGCCFPGCTRPAAWSEAHHVISWLLGGPTDIGNLCLVCPFHHRLLDRGEWEVVMTDGVPWWLPPPWLDPWRRPVRNTAHHLPEIEFERVG